jgi:ABC-type Fe3+/spermidine/putrescine transport system ATPase subunit
VRVELKLLLSRLKITAIYVTHDQAEAMALCDRVAVMDGGKIIQIGTPEEVYERPTHLFVAQFLGEANTLPYHRRDDGELEIAGAVLADGMVDPDCGAAGVVVVRPEFLTLSQVPAREGLCWPGTVTERLYLGSYTEHLVTLDGGAQVIAHLRGDRIDPGKRCYVVPAMARATWLPDT